MAYDTFNIARAGRPDITVTDFADGDRIAVDDRFFGIRDRDIRPCGPTGDGLRDLLETGLVGYNARCAEPGIDIDGTREIVADPGDNVRLTLDDGLLL